MEQAQINFDDGAAYEEFMGVWSQLAGEDFLPWLAPSPGWRWADVGCGNGAFTEMLVERCAPAVVEGIDPSEAQLAFARTRLAGRPAHFRQGGAMALPYESASFDAAAMALVIFFVPEPAKGVAEMARVVKPGGSVSAYAWDILGGGFPYAALFDEMAAMGTPPLWPPSVEAAQLESLRSLWNGAGMKDVETRVITIERSFPSFESFWAIAMKGPPVAPRVAAMGAGAAPELQQRLRRRLTPAGGGPVTFSARAHAVKGTVPR